MTELALHWFRQDLRLTDNPALLNAAAAGRVLPVFVLDDASAGEHARGGASRWWLHHSLAALERSLGGQLSLYRGDARQVLPELVRRLGVTRVSWNRCYEPWRTERDAEIKRALVDAGVAVQSFNGSLLWEPWQVHKDDGSPYKVFTPFYRKGCLRAMAPRRPQPAPQGVAYERDPRSLPLDALALQPRVAWDAPLRPHWDIGEAGARARFEAFVREGLSDYKTGRDFPDRPCVSRISPHLHFGEISPNQLWHGARDAAEGGDVEHFGSELGWREFSYSQLFYNPDLPRQNLQRKFDRFPWREDARALAAWQCGQTGVPLVDAGMRELWHTGYMHNRVRMVVASYLVKNLRLHWRHGERWFWDTLVDADLANNSASWQWVAGCGADAAPYFRIFNPVAQAKRFDPQGAYIRRHLPELAALPDKALFSPWEAPPAVLAQAGVRLGDNYPAPLVDLKSSREAALAAFQTLRQSDR